MCPDSVINNLRARINNFQNNLNQLIQSSANGAAMRSLARWVEYGKKKL